MIVSPAASATDYYNKLLSTFEVAQQQAGTFDRFYHLAGHTICLRFAGTALLAYMQAFSHLEIQPVSEPDLVVCLWEGVSTKTMVPLPPWSKPDQASNPSIEGYGSLMFWSDDRFWIGFYQAVQSLSMLDLQQNLAFYTVTDVQQLPYFEPASPLRLILHWWLSTRSIQIVHCAAVGTPEGGVLLVGKGGSGKSSSALACLESELLYAGDDYCAVAVHPVPQVFSLYSTAKLKGRADFQRFPQLLSKVSNLDNLDTEKAIFFLNSHYPEKIIQNFPLRAILLPKVTGTSHICLHPISASVALRAIAPSTLLQLVGTGQSHFTLLTQLVKCLPCYTLELGPNIPAIPQVIQNLLNREDQ